MDQGCLEPFRRVERLPDTVVGKSASSVSAEALVESGLPTEVVVISGVLSVCCAAGNLIVMDQSGLDTLVGPHCPEHLQIHTSVTSKS
jgi:hypothetical protein